MKKILWLFQAGLVALLALPIAVLPLKLSLGIGESLGLLLYRLWGSRRKIAITNLERAAAQGSITLSTTPEKIIRRFFQNFGRGFAEIIRIYCGFGGNIIDSVTFEGLEHFYSAHAKGRGVLFITGHCGNWELLAIASSATFSNLAVVARPLDNPFLNRIVERARGAYGNRVIYKRGALRNILRALKANESVGVLMDQSVIPEEGFIIDFLGMGAWTTKMPALIARKTNAAVLPAFIHRTTRMTHTIKIFPEVALSPADKKSEAIREDTEKFSSYVEEYIRQHPSEWLWIHRRWKRVKQ